MSTTQAYYIDAITLVTDLITNWASATVFIPPLTAVVHDSGGLYHLLTSTKALFRYPQCILCVVSPTCTRPLAAAALATPPKPASSLRPQSTVRDAPRVPRDVQRACRARLWASSARIKEGRGCRSAWLHRYAALCPSRTTPRCGPLAQPQPRTSRIRQRGPAVC